MLFKNGSYLTENAIHCITNINCLTPFRETLAGFFSENHMKTINALMGEILSFGH
jgi:hypothetical protein